MEASSESAGHHRLMHSPDRTPCLEIFITQLSPRDAAQDLRKWRDAGGLSRTRRVRASVSTAVMLRPNLASTKSAILSASDYKRFMEAQLAPDQPLVEPWPPFFA